MLKELGKSEKKKRRRCKDAMFALFHTNRGLTKHKALCRRKNSLRSNGVGRVEKNGDGTGGGLVLSVIFF